MTRNIRLMLQFDGTDFCGWQVQASVRTVQGDLAAALHQLTGASPTLYSSSRTDAGVHALAMPVNFHLETTLPLRAFQMGLNSLLPPDLRVLSAEDMDPAFHARFSTQGKTYFYRVQTGRVALPMERRTSWHVPIPLRIEPMREAATMLLGEHDFSAFRAAQCDAASPMRTLHRLDVSDERDHIVTIEVRANGFLRNMVRILVGNLVAVGVGRHPPAWVAGVLESRDRRLGGQTAPAQGLFLKEVAYPVGHFDGWARARIQGDPAPDGASGG